MKKQMTEMVIFLDITALYSSLGRNTRNLKLLCYAT